MNNNYANSKFSQYLRKEIIWLPGYEYHLKKDFMSFMVFFKFRTLQFMNCMSIHVKSIKFGAIIRVLPLWSVHISAIRIPK